MIQHVCLCERGCKRPQNQDRAGGWTAGDCGLFFVADGIGGHYSGETASQALADSLAAWWSEGAQMALPAAQQQLQLLVQSCHTRILQGTPPGQQCGSTLVLLWLSGGTYTLFWTGDSRCYQTRRSLLRTTTLQMTVDDVVSGDRASAADQGKLCRAVGVGHCLLSMRSGELEKGSLFTLCSDGIYKYCPPARLHRHLAKARRTALLQSCAREIEQDVLDRQAPDNYSLILVRPVL